MSKRRENGWRPRLHINLASLFDARSSSKLMFDAVGFDDELASVLKAQKARTRGNKTKLTGGCALERLAVRLAKQRRDELKARGMRPGVAWEDALNEVAPLFGVKPGTIHDWYRGINRRERNKPITERAFRSRRRSD